MTYQDKYKVYRIRRASEDRDALLFETTDYEDVERAADEHDGVSFALVSAEDQAADAERAERDAQRRAQLEREAEQRRYARTPQGQREAALRQGQRVTFGGSDMPELDEAFAGHTRADDPLVGRW